MSVSLGDLMRGAMRGKSLGRILFNERVQTRCADLQGRVLDLAGGEEPGYLPLLPSGIEVIRSNRIASEGVIAVDFDQPLPFPDMSFDAVLFFNALYIVQNPEALMREIRRILKPGGRLFLANPFIANEMPEPCDYIRHSYQGIERLCHETEFSIITIDRVGERVSAAISLISPFFLFNVFRAIVFPVAICLDRIVPTHVIREHPSPISYFVIASRSTHSL